MTGDFCSRMKPEVYDVVVQVAIISPALSSGECTISPTEAEAKGLNPCHPWLDGSWAHVRRAALSGNSSFRMAMVVANKFYTGGEPSCPQSHGIQTLGKAHAGCRDQIAAA